jgi:hypothetical protein
MGIPADVVAAEFEKRQKKANEVLKANYKRRQMRAVSPSAPYLLTGCVLCPSFGCRDSVHVPRLRAPPPPGCLSFVYRLQPEGGATGAAMEPGGAAKSRPPGLPLHH